MFTGQTLSAKFILQYINDPRNALLLEGSVHDSMDNRLAWGIEARFSDDQVSSQNPLGSEIHIPDSGNTIIE